MAITGSTGGRRLMWSDAASQECCMGRICCISSETSCTCCGSVKMKAHVLETILQIFHVHLYAMPPPPPPPPTCSHYLMPYFCFQILLSWSQPAIFLLKNICSWTYQPISVNKNILIMHIYITVHLPRLGLSHKSVCSHTPMLWTHKFYPISSTSHSLWMKNL